MGPISVLIPAYNEEKSVRGVVESVKGFMTGEKIAHEIIVIDDHSGDKTAEAARAAGATVVTHPVNRGYGASLTTGLKKAKHPHVLIIDADGTYPVNEIRKLLPYVDDFDMVVGARQGKHFHGSPVKRLSRILFHALIEYVTGDDVPDVNSGLRIFKKDVVMQFENDFCAGFSFTTTITIVLLCNLHLIQFVPIEYHSRVGSKSKVRYLRDTARTFQIVLQTISYYIPLKAFLPFAALALLLSGVFALFYLFGEQTTFYGLASVLSFLSSMLFLGLGLIAYSIVRGKKSR